MLFRATCHVLWLLIVSNTPAWGQSYICQTVDKPKMVAGDQVQIMSDSTILSGGELRLISPTVILMPGFSVRAGGKLEVYSISPGPTSNRRL